MRSQEEKGLRQIRRALISVSDKRGLIELCSVLASREVELVSTGGTAKMLKEAGMSVKDVSALTGFPELMDGRLKTLHPKVHGGILAIRDNKEHLAAMEEHGIKEIDLVVVNLYPFEQTTADPDVSTEKAIENIDIGGPTMIRAAAKNYTDVAVVTNPMLYQALINEITGTSGATTLAFRYWLMVDAFNRPHAYDKAIFEFFEARLRLPLRPYSGS